MLKIKAPLDIGHPTLYAQLMSQPPSQIHYPATWILYHRTLGSPTCLVEVSASGIAEDGLRWESSHAYLAGPAGVVWMDGTQAPGPAGIYPWLPDAELSAALRQAYHTEHVRAAVVS